MDRKYDQARGLLLDAAVVDPLDTVASHSRILAAHCLRRLGDPERALAELRELSSWLPLRMGVLEALDSLAAELGELSVQHYAMSARRNLEAALRGQ